MTSLGIEPVTFNLQQITSKVKACTNLEGPWNFRLLDFMTASLRRW